MDRFVPRRRWPRWTAVGAACTAAALLALLSWHATPRGLSVRPSDLQFGIVTAGQFHDEVLLRATVAPFETVLLDATEGGRVESVEVRDGALVEKGRLLFRLSNPQREQDVLARAADVAQQVANIATLRAALATAHADHRRRIADLEFALDRVRKSHARNERLAQQGFLSSAALEESNDTRQQQERLLAEAKVDLAHEDATRQRAIAEMDRALGGLNQGLAIVRASADALSVRAPTDGRLTDFRLEVGTSVKAGDHLGRIDTPERFKLTALVDEYYLGRMARGLRGAAELGTGFTPVAVSRLNPQVKDRRFEIEMEFSGDMPKGLQPGQTLDTRLTLGNPSDALLIPDGAFYADTGGSAVFVVSPNGDAAERRDVKLGRRGGGQIEVLEGLKPSERIILSSYAGFGDARRLSLTE